MSVYGTNEYLILGPYRALWELQTAMNELAAQGWRTDTRVAQDREGGWFINMTRYVSADA